MDFGDAKPEQVAQAAMDEAVKLIAQGLDALLRGMDSDSGYDWSRGYPAKNSYFVHAGNLGRSLLDICRQPIVYRGTKFEPWRGLAESYHSAMLQCILDYESRTGKHFNKGMVYANLGVAQIANGKIDDGVTSLLAADVEDQDFTDRDPHHILNEPLWWQFEKPHVFDYLLSLCAETCHGMHITLDQTFLVNFMDSVELQDRLLLESSIWTLQDNLAAVARLNSVHARSGLLSALRNTCWLIESLLRRSPAGQALMKDNPRATLYDHICKAVGGKGVSFPTDCLSLCASTAQQFADSLNKILRSSVDPKVRALYCLVLARNYTGHEFDPTPNPDWFPQYEQVVAQVVSAMFYLKSISALYARPRP